MKGKHAKRAWVTYGCFLALYVPVVVLTGGLWWVVVIALYLGYLLGNTLGYKLGLDDGAQIWQKVYESVTGRRK